MTNNVTNNVTSHVTSDVENSTCNVRPDVGVDLPDPPIGIEVDLHDFASMPLDVARLRDSDIAAEATAEEFRAAVLLWCASWHQIPPGSLPSNEQVIAKLAGFGRDVEAWRVVAEGAMRGFFPCSDGRLYHSVIVEKAIEVFEKRKTQSRRTAAATKARLAKRRNVPRDETRNVHQGKGKGGDITEEDKSSSAASAASLHSDLRKQIFDIGKPIIGGAQVNKLIAHFKSDLSEIHRVLLLAQEAADPRAYVGRILSGEVEPPTDWDVEYQRMGVWL